MNPRPDHPTPSPRTVFRAQLALLLAAPRRGFLIGMSYVLGQAMLLAATGLLLGVNITVTGTDTTIKMPRLSSLDVEAGIGAWTFAVGALLIVGCSFNGRVWRGTQGALGHYHWALPVERRLHDLLRVAAGSAALGAICVIVMASTVVTALLFGHGEEIARYPVAAWAAALLGPQLLYLLFAAVRLASQSHRHRRILGILGGCVFLFVILGAAVGDTFLLAMYRILWGPFGLITACFGPTLVPLLEGKAVVPGPWLPAFTLWAFWALAGVTAAASSRPKDF